jgi:hypothetical protein
LDHLCDVSIERSAGGFGTLHSLTPDDGMRTGPISLHTAIGNSVNKRSHVPKAQNFY